MKIRGRRRYGARGKTRRRRGRFTFVFRETRVTRREPIRDVRFFRFRVRLSRHRKRDDGEVGGKRRRFVPALDKRPFDFFFRRFIGRRRRVVQERPVKRRVQLFLVGRSTKHRLQRCSVRADHLVLGEPHDVPVAKELRPHRAVFVETRFTIARGAFGIVGRTAAVPRLGIRASLLRRSGGRVRPARASRVARARVARLGSNRGRADDRGRETLPPRGRLAPSRRCCRDTLGTARVPRDAAREDARDARREREREARARARGAPPPAHRGGHESRTPDRPPCARTTVAPSEIDIGTPMVLFGEEHQPAIFFGGSMQLGKKTENRMRFSQDRPNANEGLSNNFATDSMIFQRSVGWVGSGRRRSTRASTLTRADRHARRHNSLRHTACEGTPRVRTPPRAPRTLEKTARLPRARSRGDVDARRGLRMRTVRFRTARARARRPTRAPFARERARATPRAADRLAIFPAQNTRNRG